MSVDLLNLVPIMAEPIEVVVDIDHIKVRDDGEFWFGANPYLLLSVFQIDGTTARLEATVDVSAVPAGGNPTLEVKLLPANGSDSIVKVTRRGKHGNVDSVNIGPIEFANDGPATVQIDSRVGLFRKNVEPIPIRFILDSGDIFAGADVIGLPGFLGVHAILAEGDLTPDDAVIAAHQVVADGIKSILEDVLAVLDISDLSINLASFEERSAEIEDAARQAGADEMNLWSFFGADSWTPTTSSSKDSESLNVLQLGQMPTPLEFCRYQGPYGDWILVGEFRLG